MRRGICFSLPRSGGASFGVESPQATAMANLTITIPLDPETARTYDSAAPEEKRKIQALVSLWLRELAAGDYPCTAASSRRGGKQGEISRPDAGSAGFSALNILSRVSPARCRRSDLSPGQ